MSILLLIFERYPEKRNSSQGNKYLQLFGHLSIENARIENIKMFDDSKLQLFYINAVGHGNWCIKTSDLPNISRKPVSSNRITTTTHCIIVKSKPYSG